MGDCKKLLYVLSGMLSLLSAIINYTYIGLILDDDVLIYISIGFILLNYISLLFAIAICEYKKSRLGLLILTQFGLEICLQKKQLVYIYPIDIFLFGIPLTIVELTNWKLHGFDQFALACIILNSIIVFWKAARLIWFIKK